MSELFQWLLGILKEFRILVVVLPWEAVVRCRLGKHVKVWGPGWHIRLPFIDILHVTNTRLRLCCSPLQTITTLDGLALTIAATVGFCIVDPQAALSKYSEPETCIAALVQSRIASLVSKAKLTDLVVEKLEHEITDCLKVECDSAMVIEFVRLVDFAAAPAVRLLNEQWRLQTDQKPREI